VEQKTQLPVAAAREEGRISQHWSYELACSAMWRLQPSKPWPLMAISVHVAAAANSSVTKALPLLLHTEFLHRRAKKSL